MKAAPKCMTHEITKMHLKDFHTEKSKIICSDNPLFQASFPEEPVQYCLNGGGSIMLWRCFSESGNREGGR